MNCNAVITNERTTEKCGISHPVFYPKVAIVDPALTCSVPANHTAYGAMDTIAHVIESYLNGADDTPVQDRLREGVMLTVIEEAPKALAEPGNLSARTNLQWASVVALNGWANIGAGGAFPMHQIEHALSAHYDIAHGAGLAVVVPAWIKTAWRAWPERHAQLANRVFGVAACEPEAAVREGLARFEGFLKRIGNPTRLGDVGIGPEKLDRIAADVIRLSGGRERLLGGRPRLDQAGVRSVLARAL
jgi:alcohol dehydrogenase YqhD (iron-dependent ADH family)